MWIKYNPNPKRATVGDCVVRALCKALDMDWNACYCELVACGYALKDMPSANRVWGALLEQKGFKRRICECDCSVEEFCREHKTGTYILAIQGHVVCCKNGSYFDSWDSGKEMPLYYWER